MSRLFGITLENLFKINHLKKSNSHTVIKGSPSYNALLELIRLKILSCNLSKV